MGIDGVGNIVIRLQTDYFTGKMVIHCHILEHEDEGMMAWIDISGTEGATWTGAETIDSTCYRAAFAGTYQTITTTDAGTTTENGTENAFVDGAWRMVAPMTAAPLFILLVFL